MFPEERDSEAIVEVYTTIEDFPHKHQEAYEIYPSINRQERESIGVGGLISQREAKPHGLGSFYIVQQVKLTGEAKAFPERAESDGLDDLKRAGRAVEPETEDDSRPEKRLVGIEAPLKTRKRSRYRITTGGKAPRRLLPENQAILNAEIAAQDAEVDEDDPEDPRSQRFANDEAYQDDYDGPTPAQIGAPDDAFTTGNDLLGSQDVVGLAT